MKSNNLLYKLILAIEPILIFVCLKELIKLIIHNIAMNLSANNVVALGIEWGQFKTFQEVSVFLQSKSIYTSILSNLILLIIIGIMYLKESKRKRSSKTPQAIVFVKALIATVCIGLVVDNLISISGLRGVSGNYQVLVNSFVGMEFWIMAIATVILAPLVEELVFRGLVYTRCKELVGRVGAIIISSASFGLIHGNLVQFIYAGIIGVLMCIFYERTSNIWVPVICHMAVNLVALLSMYFGILNWMYTNNMVLIGSLVLYTGLGVLMMNNVKRGK